MQTSLIICIVVFLVAVVLLEKFRSLNILIRLVLSLGLIYGYIMAISNGKSIILFSILLAFLLAVVNIFIKNGIHKESFSELISVVVTSCFSSSIIFIIGKINKIDVFKNAVMNFDGVKTSENAITGVFILATLGIFMDIISRIVFELNEQKDKTVDIPWKEQYKKGIELGKKYIIDKTNLIVLICLGISMFSICENINKGMNILDVLVSTKISAYILVSIVANIGLVFSVPITSFVYASLNRKKTVYKTESSNKLDGKRSLKL